MDDKIIIDRMDAEEFLSMLTDAAMQGDNVTQYYSTRAKANGGRRN